MKIAINATYNPDCGSKVQLVNLLKYFLHVNDIEIVLFIREINVGIIEEFDQSKIKVVISKIAGISTIIRVIWEQTVLPLLLLKERVDVLFCPGNIAPIY